MPTRIYLVRHGAIDLTAEDRFAGSSEVPLSDGSSPLSLINSNTWLMCRHVTALIISMAYEAVGEDPSEEGRRQLAGLAAEFEDGSRHHAQGLERAKQQ
jgi:hypothetical protein